MIRLRTEKIEELSRKRGFASQAALARASEWSPRHFNRVVKDTQRGRAPSFTIEKLNNLCNALRCKASAILEHELDPLE